ncbi:uncharacterized protein Pyn_08231 [Prunus yedoensis var. nudiflora]|uniref:Uncharacterized protein n=1 Tax=Prunus yedoensis var. nudiflora TaxID=2094558 RepID=A0A314YTC5_PRUYE|nr:uncharacterized protein Pyn_08231 [Prunus yedoensis var. nudiflora]
MTTKEKAWRPVDWRTGKRAHKTFFALPSQNMLGWENRGSSNPIPPVEVQKDELVERYPGIARVVCHPQPTDDVASEREDIDDLLKFPHPLCGHFLKNAIDVRIL